MKSKNKNLAGEFKAVSEAANENFDVKKEVEKELEFLFCEMLRKAKLGEFSYKFYISNPDRLPKDFKSKLISQLQNTGFKIKVLQNHIDISWH